MHATKAALAPTSHLVTDGVYRLTRHPNYIGDWLRYLSFCVCSGKTSSYVLMTLIATVNIARPTLMELYDTWALHKTSHTFWGDKYGEKYTQWIDKVPCYLPIPSVESASIGMTVVAVWIGCFFVVRMWHNTDSKKEDDDANNGKKNGKKEKKKTK